MLKTKVFEVRDRCTRIIVVATKLTSGTAVEKALVNIAGFAKEDDRHAIMVTHLSNMTSYTSAHEAQQKELGRTMRVAVEYIQAGFATLQSGDIVDVEFILKETAQPKESEYK